MARKHKVDEVLKALVRKNDVRGIDTDLLCIEILTDKIWDRKKGSYVPNPKRQNDIGNGTWGKIDFLCNYHDYFVLRVEK